MEDKDKQLIKKLIIGGAALGGGAGLTVAYFNHMRQMGAERTQSNKRVQALYRRLEKERAKDLGEMSKEAGVSGALGVTGGVAAAAASYVLAEAVYRDISKKRAKRELRASIKDYDKLLEQQAKSASADETAEGRPLSGFEWAFNSAVSVPLIVALGAAIGTDQYLKWHDPRKKRKPKWAPKDYTLEELESGTKTASAATDLLTAGLLVLHTKEGSTGALADMVGVVLEGNTPALVKAASADPEAALDAIEGACAGIAGAGDVKLAAALQTLANTPELSDTAGLYIAAEFADAFPQILKVASGIAPEEADALQETATRTTSEALLALIDKLPEEEMQELHAILEEHVGQGSSEPERDETPLTVAPSGADVDSADA